VIGRFERFETMGLRLKRKLGQRRLVDRSGKDEPSYSLR
jgi:hypothetical protein